MLVVHWVTFSVRILMQVVAKDQIKRTAEGKGVKWDAHVKALQATSEVSSALLFAMLYSAVCPAYASMAKVGFTVCACGLVGQPC